MKIAARILAILAIAFWILGVVEKTISSDHYRPLLGLLEIPFVACVVLGFVCSRKKSGKVATIITAFLLMVCAWIMGDRDFSIFFFISVPFPGRTVTGVFFMISALLGVIAGVRMKVKPKAAGAKSEQ